MIKLKAVREVRYAGKTYLPGEVFSAHSEKDVKALKLMRKVEDAGPDIVPKHQPAVAAPVQTKVLVPEELPVDLPPVAPPAPIVEETTEETPTADEPAVEQPAEAGETDGHQGRNRRYRRRDMRSEV
jgi:hypothetical protein